MDEFRKNQKWSQRDLNEFFKLAIELNNPIFEVFLQMGADPNAHHCLAIREKCQIGDLNAIKKLCQYGADPEPGLETAIIKGHYDIVKFFFEEQGLKPFSWSLRDAMKNNDMRMGQLILREYLDVLF